MQISRHTVAVQMLIFNSKEFHTIQINIRSRDITNEPNVILNQEMYLRDIHNFKFKRKT